MLQALGGLGSDVPFFVTGGQALEGQAVGMRSSLKDDDADYALVIVVPGISISTREAYSWLTVLR